MIPLQQPTEPATLTVPLRQPRCADCGEPLTPADAIAGRCVLCRTVPGQPAPEFQGRGALL